MGAQDQRPRFFEGQYLGAADLSAAVDYARLQQARHMLGAHAWGIAIGLHLKAAPAPGGAKRVDMFIQPGYAWDGFGRPIVALVPARIPETLFADIAFDAGKDGPSAATPGRPVAVWLQYEENTAFNPAPGFENCDSGDQHARIQETFRIEIGDQPESRQRSGIIVAGRTVDARDALISFDRQASRIHDRSIPHQMFPSDQRRARWLIPIGYVRWVAGQNSLGHFVEPTDAEKAATRKIRRYIGTVTENIEAADGAIVLRQRGNDPNDAAANTFHGLLNTNDPGTGVLEDLVWVEGKLRVVGDLKLAGGRLDFRSGQGKDEGTPLRFARSGDGSGASGKRELRFLLGPADQRDNKFLIGPSAGDKKDPDAVDAALTVTSEKKVGVNTSAPVAQMEIKGNWDGEEGALRLTGDKPTIRFSADTTAGSQNWIAHVGSSGNGNFEIQRRRTPSGWDMVLTATTDNKVGVATSRPRCRLGIRAVGDAEELISFENGDGATKWHINQNLPGAPPGLNIAETGEQDGRLFIQQVSGNVGIGTINPLLKLDIRGDFGHSEGAATVNLWGARIGDVGDSRLFLRAVDDGVVAIDGTRNSVAIGTDPAEILRAKVTVRSNDPAQGKLHFFPAGADMEYDGGNDKLFVFRDTGGRTAFVGGNVGIGTDNPLTRLHVTNSITGNAVEVGNHVACIENTSSDTDADVLALKVGATTTGGGNNFITFFGGSGPVGRIEGNGANVAYETSAGDFAEHLDFVDAGETIRDGDVVGIFDGRISLRTEGAQGISVISGQPGFVGAARMRHTAHPGATTAMMGQVAVNVTGPVQAGDYLLPAGLQDGTARAVAPDRLALEQVGQVIGVAWDSCAQPGHKRINTAIGVVHNRIAGSLAQQLAATQADVRQLRQLVEQLLTRDHGK